MKPILTICLFVSLAALQSLVAQQFVNPANIWYVDDVCYDFSSGEIDRFTYEYSFSEEVTEIGGQAYRELITNNQTPLTAFGIGKYYRESNGQVFLKIDENSAEFLIYNFNVALGEEFTIGQGSDNPLVLKVLAIDAVTLENGESRKRIELCLASHPDVQVVWVEGIGSHLAPMNTLDMFMLDCWIDLDCFRFEGETQYQLGDCELGSPSSTGDIFEKHEVAIFPNPVADRFSIMANVVIARIRIFDARGNLLRSLEGRDLTEIPAGDLPPGVYFVEMRDGDGRLVRTARMIKG